MRIMTSNQKVKLKQTNEQPAKEKKLAQGFSHIKKRKQTPAKMASQMKKANLQQQYDHPKRNEGKCMQTTHTHTLTGRRTTKK